MTISFAKISALEKASELPGLTETEADILRQCADDYRPMIRLGPKMKITKAHVITALEIIFDDVRFMTGARRQAAIRLLKETGARGFDVVPISIPDRHPTDEHLADAMSNPVTDDEIRVGQFT